MSCAHLWRLKATETCSVVCNRLQVPTIVKAIEAAVINLFYLADNGSNGSGYVKRSAHYDKHTELSPGPKVPLVSMENFIVFQLLDFDSVVGRNTTPSKC